MDEELFRQIQQFEAQLVPAERIRAFIERQGLDVDTVRLAYQAWQRRERPPDPIASSARGFTRGLRDIGQGVKQGVKILTGAEDLEEYTARVNEEREAYKEQRGGRPDPARFLGQIAATAPAMLVPGAREGLVARLVAGAGAGALTGAAQFAPSGTAGEKVVQTVTGGVGGAVLPEAMRYAFRGPAWLATRATARPTPEAASRLADYQALGVRPTTAQITRNPVGFAEELNLAQLPAGEPLAAVRAAQPGQLARTLEGVVPGRPATDVAAGRQIQQAIGQRRGATGAYGRMGRPVNELYEAARSAPGVDDALDVASFASRIGGIVDDFEDAIPSAVTKRIQSFADDRPFTVGEAFKLRQLINARSRATQDPATKEGLRQLKTALDGFLEEQPVGGEALSLFRQANAAAAQRARAFEAVPLKRTVDGRLAPDQFIRKHVVGGTVDDLASLKTTLLERGGAEGAEAWNTARRQVVDFLYNQSVNDAGAFSASGFNRALTKLGDDRLAILFSPTEAEMLRRVGRGATGLFTAPAAGGVPVGNRSGTAAAMFRQAPLVRQALETLRQTTGVRRALAGRAVDPLANRAAARLLAGRMAAPQVGLLTLNPWAPIGGSVLTARR